MPLSDDELERYARHLVLRQVGGSGQAKLRAARVLVVGAGGLGCPAILYLAAAGIGTIGIADFDAVALSNLQRQIAYRTSDIGRAKTAAAADAARAINPHVALIEHGKLTAQNAAEIVAGYDIVADGSDNFETRFLVNDTCFHAGKVLVFAAVTEFEGQLATFKAHDGRHPCYRCLFPAPPPAGTAPSCSEAGVLGAAAGVMGTLQALEVLKEVLGTGESLAGKLLIFDALAMRFRTVTMPRDPACSLCGNGTAATGLTAS